jgi:HAMP domain-containing protein
MIVVSGTAIGFIFLIGNTTTNQSTEALKEQIKTNIIGTAENNGDVIVSKLQNSAAKIEMLAQQIEEVMTTTDLTYDPRPSYYNNATNPPDSIYDPSYGLSISWNYSNFDFPGATPSNWESLVTPEINNTIQRSAHLDYTFKMIHETSPEFRWIYAGFEDCGLFRNYPGSPFQNIKDARTRDWYIPAKQQYTNNPTKDSELIYIAPYYDISEGTLLISVVKGAVHNNQLIGVAGGDITIATIQDKILDIQVLESGFAAMTQGSDGVLVAHPDWEGSASNDTIPYLSEFEPLSQNQISQITSSSSGVIEYTRDGETWYLAHVSILEGEYSICVLVPEKEALESVSDLETQIDRSTRLTIIEVVIIVAIAAILAIVVGVFTANRIVRPINKLTQIASRMSTDTIRDDLANGIDLEIDEELEEQDDEIGDLTRAFKGMINSIQEESEDNTR